MLTRYGVLKLLKYTVFTIAALIVVGYAVFATHDLYSGPEIIVTEPIDGTKFTASHINIKGVVARIQEISLNGRPITIDEEGNFDEDALLAPGYNIFTLAARDKFGRSKEVRLELVYEVN